MNGLYGSALRLGNLGVEVLEPLLHLLQVLAVSVLQILKIIGSTQDSLEKQLNAGREGTVQSRDRTLRVNFLHP